MKQNFWFRLQLVTEVDKNEDFDEMVKEAENKIKEALESVGVEITDWDEMEVFD